MISNTETEINNDNDTHKVDLMSKLKLSGKLKAYAYIWLILERSFASSSINSTVYVFAL